MLTRLHVRNVVLIETLDLEFGEGLTVLTGETGAGKSILLDALGLALGARADFDLIGRYGDDAEVAACFTHQGGAGTAMQILADAGIETEEGEELVLRRLLRGGKSSAFINDMPVAGGLLRRIGAALVEVEGQFEGRGLLDVSTHRVLLDRYAGAEAEVALVASAWNGLTAARKTLADARETLAAARSEEEWLRDAVTTLDALAPEEGEESRLAEERAMRGNISKIAEALDSAEAAITGSGGHDGQGESAAAGVAARLGPAMRALERVAEHGGAMVAPVLEAMMRADAELTEASAAIAAVRGRLEADPGRFAAIDDRLHDLRAQARKHRVEVDGLPAIHRELAARLKGLDDGSRALARLAERTERAQGEYDAARAALRAMRIAAAAELDRRLQRELPALKLEAARLATIVEDLPPERHGAHGAEQIRFEVATNPGSPQGPIDRIASGGELARFLLALKVVLAGTSPSATLIFDEVDSGVGGAVAAAVGERLARLGENMQCLVITHSPQVASRGDRHFRIAKTGNNGGAISTAEILEADGRLEEIGRMLAGATITPEARAAASRLLEQG